LENRNILLIFVLSNKQAMQIEFNHIKIFLGTSFQMYETIGHDFDFRAAVCCKPEKKNQAIKDLTDHFNQFNKVLETGIAFTTSDYNKYFLQFQLKAKKRALQVMENAVLKKGYLFTYIE